MAWPKSAGWENDWTYNRLSKKSGADFDRAFMNDQIKDHKDDIKMYSNEATKGKDRDVKAFAADMVPALEHHLDMASSVDHSAGGERGSFSDGSSGLFEAERIASPQIP